MPRSRIIASVAIATYITIMTVMFFINLPVWCAHPERPGSKYVQGLCNR